MTAQHNSDAYQAVLETHQSVDSLISKLQSHPTDDANYKQLLEEVSTFRMALSDLLPLLPDFPLELDENLPGPLRLCSSMCTGLREEIQELEESAKTLDWSTIACGGRTIPAIITSMKTPHHMVDYLNQVATHCCTKAVDQ